VYVRIVGIRAATVRSTLPRALTITRASHAGFRNSFNPSARGSESHPRVSPARQSSHSGIFARERQLTVPNIFAAFLRKVRNAESLYIGLLVTQFISSVYRTSVMCLNDLKLLQLPKLEVFAILSSDVDVFESSYALFSALGLRLSHVRFTSPSLYLAKARTGSPPKYGKKLDPLSDFLSRIAVFARSRFKFV
jgi:hypothetical protein